jgi:hypothetical protein
MKVGSIVEYIGGQCPIGISLCPLEKNLPYVVSMVGVAQFAQGIRPSIKLEEHPKFSFLILMFRELQGPEDVDIEELLKGPELVTINK